MLSVMRMSCVLLFISTPVLAQNSPTNAPLGQPATPEAAVNSPPIQQPAPQTKLEQATELTGTILIKGQADVGSVSTDQAEISVFRLHLHEDRICRL